jgi:hypothetical protein
MNRGQARWRIVLEVGTAGREGDDDPVLMATGRVLIDNGTLGIYDEKDDLVLALNRDTWASIKRVEAEDA